MVTLLYQVGVTDSIVYFEFLNWLFYRLEGGRVKLNADSSDDEVVVRDIVQ